MMKPIEFEFNLAHLYAIQKSSGEAKARVLAFFYDLTLAIYESGTRQFRIRGTRRVSDFYPGTSVPFDIELWVGRESVRVYVKFPNYSSNKLKLSNKDIFDMSIEADLLEGELVAFDEPHLKRSKKLIITSSTKVEAKKKVNNKVNLNTIPEALRSKLGIT